MINKCLDTAQRGCEDGMKKMHYKMPERLRMFYFREALAKYSLQKD